MEHRADPVHLTSRKFPKACLYYYTYNTNLSLNGHLSDENLFLVAKTVTGRDYTHLDQVLRVSCTRNAKAIYARQGRQQ